MKALKKSADLKVTSDTVEIAVATMKTKEFVILSPKEIEKYIK